MVKPRQTVLAFTQSPGPAQGYPWLTGHAFTQDELDHSSVHPTDNLPENLPECPAESSARYHQSRQVSASDGSGVNSGRAVPWNCEGEFLTPVARLFVLLEAKVEFPAVVSNALMTRGILRKLSMVGRPGVCHRWKREKGCRKTRINTKGPFA